MTTPSPRLGLAVPSQADNFSTQDLADNWSKIDRAPGVYPCTSSTRPSWGAAQAGREIRETNTGLSWWWTGTAWVRTSPTGLLHRADGNLAIGTRAVDFTTVGTGWAPVVAMDFVVPDGYRPLRFDTTIHRIVASDVSTCFGAMFLSNSPGAGPCVGYVSYGKGINAEQAGGTLSGFIGALAPGVYQMSYQVRSNTAGQGMTVKVVGAQPITIAVTEL